MGSPVIDKNMREALIDWLETSDNKDTAALRHGVRELIRDLDLLNNELIEKCAGIAESEPWPEGPAPAEVLEASASLTYEQIIKATVKATRESIAGKIRALAVPREGKKSVFCLEHRKVMTNGICPKCGQQ